MTRLKTSSSVKYALCLFVAHVELDLYCAVRLDAWYFEVGGVATAPQGCGGARFRGSVG